MSVTWGSSHPCPQLPAVTYKLALTKVGCGGGKGKADATKSGTFLVLKSENLSLRHEAKVRHENMGFAVVLFVVVPLLSFFLFLMFAEDGCLLSSLTILRQRAHFSLHSGFNSVESCRMVDGRASAEIRIHL